MKDFLKKFGRSLFLWAFFAGSPALAFDWGGVSLDGLGDEAVEASSLSGKVVLVVNVASRCGFTSQYKGLQALYEKYKSKGLVVLGEPGNQFLGQEPGTSQEIATFCSTRYGVTFPMLEKQKVNGSERSSLYTALVQSKVGEGKRVGWNFEKFIVGRDGSVVGRFGSRVAPESGELISAIEAALSPSPAN